jgi:NAD(P)-dependent dehydrogenase (short-subunit alcohol dehydrogenase family)
LFAQEGANVILADISLEGAQKGAKIIAERYPNVKAIAAKTDVGKEADVKAAVDLAVKEFGRLDIMVSGSFMELIPSWLTQSQSSLTTPVIPVHMYG